MDENSGQESEEKSKSIALLELNNIGFKYGERAVFSDLTLSVKPGDMIIISGPSGSGKSTLLRLLNRLRDPDSGTISFNGRFLVDYEVVELRRRICYLQQTPLMVAGTVRDNLLLAYKFRSARGMEPAGDAHLGKELEQYELSNVSLSSNALNLSVGQKQHIALIRGLMLNPSVLLLDEPTSSLDPQSRSIVEDHIESIVSEKGVAAIIVSHMDFQPQRVKARRYRLSGGALSEISS